MPVKEDLDVYARKEVTKLTGLPKITDDELRKHNNEYGLWVALYGKVFDLTNFYMDHPGGWDVIEECAGKECTERFEEGEHMPESIRDLKQYYIGDYEGKKQTLKEKKEEQAKE